MLKQITYLLGLILAIGFLVQCTDDDPEIKITNLTFDTASVEVTEGTTIDLNDYLIIEGEDANQAVVSFTTSNNEVVTVNDVVLSAVGVGTAEIVATEANTDLTATIDVTVIPNVVAVTGISLDKTEAELKVGDELQLTATIAPENASEKGVIWAVSFPSDGSTSEDEPTDVATVSEAGLVSAKAAGDVVVIAKTLDGEFMANASISVTNQLVTSLTIAPNSFSVNVGETQQLEASFEPANATNKEVTWSIEKSSSNCRSLASEPVYATIDENGLVTGVENQGCYELTVVATSGDGPSASATFDVIQLVTSLSVFDGDTEVGDAIENCDDIQFSVVVSPANASDQSVTWSIEENDAFEVDQTGLVSHKEGYIFTDDVSVTVTVTANDESGVSTSFQNNFTLYGACH
ncbi:Ig-like domain-containing protein [Reichenbachiella sp.]|uniref:Ig-like domain-containing protein n=1 Tax=Reichenbachiella sp. TaxID=2184521 RepID=UPI003BAEC20A